MASEDSGIAKVDRGLRKAGQAVKDYAPVAAGVTKTFLKGSAGSGSEKDIDYGPGPKPAPAKTAKPPEDWYKAYGKSAGPSTSTSTLGRKVGSKKGRRKVRGKN